MTDHERIADEAEWEARMAAKQAQLSAPGAYQPSERVAFLEAHGWFAEAAELLELEIKTEASRQVMAEAEAELEREQAALAEAEREREAIASGKRALQAALAVEIGRASGMDLEPDIRAAFVRDELAQRILAATPPTPQPRKGLGRLLVLPPPCPLCGPGTMTPVFETTRHAWKNGLGLFACRRCGFGGVWRVPARRGPWSGAEEYPGLEAWVYDATRT